MDLWQFHNYNRSFNRMKYAGHVSVCMSLSLGVCPLFLSPSIWIKKRTYKLPITMFVVLLCKRNVEKLIVKLVNMVRCYIVAHRLLLFFYSIYFQKEMQNESKQKGIFQQ